MAKLTVGGSVTNAVAGLFDDLTLDLAGLTTVSATSTKIRLTAGDLTLVIKGTGLQAAILGGLPVATGGTVDKIILTGPSGDVFRLIDLGWSFKDLTDAMAAEGSDPTAMDDFVLDNAFTYVGSDNADILLSGAVTDSGVPLTFAEGDIFRLNGGDDVFSLGTGNDRALGGSGNDVISGEAGNDRLLGQSGNDALNGGSGRDRILGHSGSDLLTGGADNDTLKGGDGGDTLIGSGGDDTLMGDGGDDKLLGGDGNDTLIGGGGADEFNYLTGGATGDQHGADIIRDFAVGQDVLLLDSPLTWTITSGNGARLVLTDADGDTIVLRGVETGTVTIADLI